MLMLLLRWPRIVVCLLHRLVIHTSVFPPVSPIFLPTLIEPVVHTQRDSLRGSNNVVSVHFRLIVTRTDNTFTCWMSKQLTVWMEL